MSHEEIVLDIEELTKLHQLAERPRVKGILVAEVEKLKSSEMNAKPQTVSNQGSDNQQIHSGVNEVQDTSSASSPLPSAPVVVATAVSKRTAAPAKYYKDITTYAWDQSDKYMKIYVTVKDVQKLPKESITTEFKNKSFRLRVENLDGSNYQCHVAHLWDDIVPADSYHKVKNDTVLVMLQKAQAKKTWAYVTEREDKKKKTSKPDEKKDPNEGLMDLLKQMYEEGDDEMKKTIAKSFTESKNKKPDDI